MGERIEARLKAKGWSQAELARRIGVKSTSIWKLVSGQSHTSRHLHLIARELDTTVEYLLGETDSPDASGVADRQVAYRGPEPERDDSLVEVVVSDIAYGLGGAFIDDATAVTTIERFPRAFIRQFTRSPESGLYFATGVGDSMEPTIHSSDLVLIDRGQEMLRVSDQIWACAAGHVSMVKRVRVLPDGSVLLVSDKPGVSDYAVAQDELQLIGRVVAVVKKV